MAILVLAEHDNQSLKAATLNTVTAAQQLSDRRRHRAGCRRRLRRCRRRCRKDRGVAKVLVADEPDWHQLAENLSSCDHASSQGITAISWRLRRPSGKKRAAACRSAAGRAADLRNQRGRGHRHLRAPDLCRQRDGDREVIGFHKGHHSARHDLRPSRAEGGSAAIERPVAQTRVFPASSSSRNPAVTVLS